jgi:hypothetical protein
MKDNCNESIHEQYLVVSLNINNKSNMILEGLRHIIVWVDVKRKLREGTQRGNQPRPS